MAQAMVDHSPTPSHTHNTYQQYPEVSTHPGIQQPLPDNLFPSPSGHQAIYTTRTSIITQNIVPLTFPNKQTFGNPLDQAKPNGHIHLAFCNIPGFPFDIHNNSKVQDLWAFQTQFQVDIFGSCKSNLNWKKCLQLEGYTNGSVLLTLSMLSQATTSMMTLDNHNLVVPFSWAMGKSHALSLLLALTLQDWDTGSGLPYLAGQELPWASSPRALEGWIAIGRGNTHG